MPSGLELIQLVSNLAIPILVALFGLLLLRKGAHIKTEIAKQSEFKSKWVDQFFECGHVSSAATTFMKTIERTLAGLVWITKNSGKKDYTDLEKQINDYVFQLSELELRIRRSVVFAPKTGDAADRAANECIQLVSSLLQTKSDDLDEIIEAMKKFNHAFRHAHAEMLGV